MRPVKIFTDSTADLSIELRKQYNISLIPLYVTIGGQTYRDQIDIDTSKLYELVDEGRATQDRGTIHSRFY